jgi:inosine-uridine nucleoside N-ribohydrolase
MKLPLLTTLLLSSAIARAEPVPIILDCDMGNDVDDVMELAMIHALETRGACQLLAVTLTKDHPKAAAFTNLLNTFYGCGDIPIGVVHQGAAPEQGKYLGLADDTATYPHALKSGADAPEAVSLLRKTLAARPDGSVVIVQTGFFTNLARLLDSPADESSPLTGRALVAKKVRLLSLMAGAFQPIGSDPHFKEYNVVNDIPAARKFAAAWPTPMLWSGFEIGIAAAYPHQSIAEDFNYTPHHPVKDAYRLFYGDTDCPTWDLTALLGAVLPQRHYFTLSNPGAVTVGDDGSTTFTEDEKGLSRFLKMDPLEAARVREACVNLVSQPPRQVPLEH